MQFFENSIFWVEVHKIKPNPYQPRKEFNEEHLQSLADSIRQYGVLQALVVTRKEIPKEDGGLTVEYELVSGERRLRAATKAGIQQVPVLIKTGDETNLMKLELAIIENVQREDLNAVERAKAFDKLVKEFEMSHTQVAKKVGKSREYVSNTLRILSLPEEILEALSANKISEGHTRPLMMLSDRPAEQSTLFKEIVYKKISVREAERIAKKIATDKVRKKTTVVDPELLTFEQEFTESLGTRVSIEKREVGGRLSIDFFSNEDLKILLEVVRSNPQVGSQGLTLLEKFIAKQEATKEAVEQNSTKKIDQDDQTEPNSSTALEQDDRINEADLTKETTYSGYQTPNVSYHLNPETEPNQYQDQGSTPTRQSDPDRTNYDQVSSDPAPETNFSQPPSPDQPLPETPPSAPNSWQHQTGSPSHPPFHSQNDLTATSQQNFEQRPPVEDQVENTSANQSAESQTPNSETEKKDDSEDDIYSIKNFTI